MLLFMALCSSACIKPGCGFDRLIIVPRKSQAPKHYLNFEVTYFGRWKAQIMGKLTVVLKYEIAAYYGMQPLFAVSH